MTLKPWHAADVPLTIKLKASQTGNALQVKNSAGVVYALGPSNFASLFTLPDDGVPASLTNGSTLNDISATANAGWIKVVIGATTRYIALYAAKA